MLKQKKLGLKAAARKEFLTKILREVENKDFVEKKLSKKGDVTSVDIRLFCGSVRYEYLVFAEADGSELVRIAKKKVVKECPQKKNLIQLAKELPPL